MSETVDPKLDAAQDFFKRVIWDGWVNVVITAIIAQAPYLGWGPIGWCLKKGFTYFADKLFAFQKLQVDILAIQLLNQEHQRAFNRELALLKVIGRLHPPGTPEYAEAEKAAFDALEKFAHYNGAKS